MVHSELMIHNKYLQLDLVLVCLTVFVFAAIFLYRNGKIKKGRFTKMKVLLAQRLVLTWVLALWETGLERSHHYQTWRWALGQSSCHHHRRQLSFWERSSCRSHQTLLHCQTGCTWLELQNQKGTFSKTVIWKSTVNKLKLFLQSKLMRYWKLIVSHLCRRNALNVDGPD